MFYKYFFFAQKSSLKIFYSNVKKHHFAVSVFVVFFSSSIHDNDNSKLYIQILDACECVCVFFLSLPNVSRLVAYLHFTILNNLQTWIFLESFRSKHETFTIILINGKHDLKIHKKQIFAVFPQNRIIE